MLSLHLPGVGQERSARASETHIGFEQQLLTMQTSSVDAHLFLALHSLTDEHRSNGPQMKLSLAV
jgi:hypothetical protein